MINKQVIRFVGVFLFRIAIAWTALHFAGFEYLPHEVALILVAGWALFYGLGGKQVTNLVYKGNENAS